MAIESISVVLIGSWRDKTKEHRRERERERERREGERDNFIFSIDGGVGDANNATSSC